MKGFFYDKARNDIFDYGHTLLYEPNHNTMNGNKAIYPYISENPDKISLNEFDKICTEIFAKIKAGRGSLEIHEHTFLRLAYDYMNIKLSVPIEDAEEIIWNGISKGGVMPYADKMLEFLSDQGIRTGVISNLCFSENALMNRINRLLPKNKFEFVLTSSEYVFNKPDRTMFEIALKKAGITADKAWFCGDSIDNDILGAHGAGIFPVLYEGETDEMNPFHDQNKDKKVDFDYLHIHHWNELIDIIKEKCNE